MTRTFLILGIALLFATCTENKTPDSNNTKTADSTTGHDSTISESDKTAKDTSTGFSGNQLIIPGKSIGKIELGITDSLLTIKLGKPDMSDAAMGKAWLTWYGKKKDEHNNSTQLNVFTAYKDTSMREKTVQQVRTTSSYFTTENGLHVYSSLDEIQHKFPKIKKAAIYTDSRREIIIYDEQQQGIAFEIASANEQNICTGIIIHQPGIKVTQTYLSLHPDMHILQ